MEETIWQTSVRHCSNSKYFTAILVLFFISRYRDSSSGNWDSVSFCINKEQFKENQIHQSILTTKHAYYGFSHIDQANAETKSNWCHAT